MYDLRNLVLTGALALLAAGCGSSPEPLALTPTAERASATSAAPTSAAEPDRYVNEEAGISLILPAGWGSAGPFPVAVDNSSYDLYLLGPDASPNAGPGASRLIVAADEALTVEAFLESQCTTCTPAEISNSIINGIQVQRALLGGGGVPFIVEWVFLDRDGRLVGLSIHDPDTLETLEPVLETLQLNEF